MSEPCTELLEPFSEQNCTAWAELIRKLLAEDTPFEVRMVYLHEWETKAQAQFLRAISTVQSLRSTNRDLLTALESAVGAETARCGAWGMTETAWLASARDAIKKALPA